MRIARKLFAVAIMAVAALAMSASSASAGPVEVVDENGIHCSSVSVVSHVVSGGCQAHIVSTGGPTIQLIRHLTIGEEVVTLNCNNEYRLNLDEFGEGWIHGISFPPGDVGCNNTTLPCVEAGSGEHVGPQEPWRIHIEETGPGTEHAMVRLCLRLQVGINAFCEVEGDVEIGIFTDGLGRETFETGKDAPHPPNILEEQSRPINRVVVAHGEVDHLTCEGLASQIEFAGHWETEADTFDIIHPLP
jgi:hypothetical protein